MERRGPDRWRFFKAIAKGGFTGAITFAVIFGMNSCTRNDYNTGNLNYKRGVFNGVFGKKLPLEESPKSFFAKGWYVGLYLRDAAKKGIEFEKSVVYLKRAKEVNFADSKSLTDWLKSAYDVSDEIPSGIFGAGNNYESFNFSVEEKNSLKAALKGERNTAPEWYATYSEIPPWASWRLYIVVVQNFAFAAYLFASIKHSRNFSWYRFPQYKMWPYVGVSLLSPGALPLMLIFGIGVGVMHGWTGLQKYRVQSKKGASLDGVTSNARQRFEELKRRQRAGGIK